jgi:hypothetical protein
VDVYRSGNVVQFANRLIFCGCGPKRRGLKMNKLPVKRLVLIALALVVIAAPAYGFRCGTRVISEGDYKDKVLAECGQPTYVEVWQEERIYNYYPKPVYKDRDHRSYREPLLVKEFVTVEQWTYNLGSYRLIRYLYFENGKLVRIKTGEHGY